MDNKLPFYIEILFENFYLDILNLLCVLSVFKSKWSGIKIRELSFYYCIIISKDNKIENNEIEDIKFDIQSLYINFEKDLKRIVLYLYNLNFIEITKKDDKDFDKVKIKITDKGLQTVNSLESSYFTEVISYAKKIKSEVTFSKENENIILGVSENEV
ncbi:hypothetical protein [Orenia marismortui]|uniref:Uncharacterized protein n=1 Tax=Orenia marismortui TaxID=46469 RepID=A0A4R8GPP2_9FIRM|nr:hypothetical protein [Orenia marismortui]TDX43547.1 hypothetical protein C7959_1662 [Orenia marismortui]